VFKNVVANLFKKYLHFFSCRPLNQTDKFQLTCIYQLKQTFA